MKKENDNNLNEELETEEFYDEENDEYYSREDVEKAQRYLSRQKKREDFKKKAKNPFGLSDKMDSLDDKILSSKKGVLIMAIVMILLLLIVLSIIIFLH